MLCHRQSQGTPPGSPRRMALGWAPEFLLLVSLLSPLPSDESPQTPKNKLTFRPPMHGSEWPSVSLNLVLYGLPNQAIV